jgi:hypothetical protein
MTDIHFTGSSIALHFLKFNVGDSRKENLLLSIE